MSQTVPSPQGLQQTLETGAVLKEVLSGLPVLAVMWYMLKDLKSSVKSIASELTQVKDNIKEVEIAAAKNSSPIKIAHLEERAREDRASIKEEFDSLKKRQALIESQQSAMWEKVGDRPEDIRKRMGESS